MPNTPKLREPDQLPAHGVTEVQLKKWEDQLRTYLLQFDDYNLFLDLDESTESGELKKTIQTASHFTMHQIKLQISQNVAIN